MNSPHAQTAQLGKKFQTEMGGIATAYTAFAGTWNSAKAISSNPDAFRKEANKIFKALHTRIQQENLELYPLAVNA